MARLTRKTFMGDYAVAAPCRNEDEYLNALREVVQRLGKLEDEAEPLEQVGSSKEEGRMPDKTHYKKLINPDYLGAYAIEDGQDLVVTIDSLSQEAVTGVGGKVETCPVMRFKEGDVKPMIVNSTNFKTLRKLFQSPYIEDWYGRQIALYADRNVRFGGEIVEGLRIRPGVPAPQDVACAECGQIIRDSGKYKAASIVKSSVAKHGTPLCYDCYAARKEAADAADK